VPQELSRITPTLFILQANEAVHMVGQGRKAMDTARKQACAPMDSPRSVILMGGIEIVYRAVSEDTQGRYSLFESTMSPGKSTPVHVHSKEDELFYVLDGIFNVQVGEQSFEAARGWFGLGPRHVPHSFEAVGTSPATMLVIVTPAGLERFFDELAEQTAVPAFDLDRVRAVFRKYGLQMIEPK